MATGIAEGEAAHPERLIGLLRQSSSSSLEEGIHKFKEETEADAQNKSAKESILWLLADNAGVEEAMAKYITHRAGAQTDPVLEWLYEVCTGAAAFSAQRRFVARFAPLLACKYLLTGSGLPGRPPLPGIQALLEALFEVQAEEREGQSIMPGLWQPSVFHQPWAELAKLEGLHHPKSRVSLIPDTAKVPTPPPTVASVLGRKGANLDSEAEPRVPRGTLAGAAFHAFTCWMSTFHASALQQVLEAIPALALSGCSWLEADAARVLKEHAETDVTLQACIQLPAAPQASSVRVHLAAEIMGPLCQILGHVLLRAGRMPVSEDLAAVVPSGSRLVWTKSQSNFMTGVAALLYSRAVYDIIPENVIFTQALLVFLGLCKYEETVPTIPWRILVEQQDRENARAAAQ